MEPWLKLGKNSPSFQSKTLIPQNKNQIFQNFLTYFTKTIYENHESIFDDFFRIKSADSSNYRGVTFSPPAKRSQILILSLNVIVGDPDYNLTILSRLTKLTNEP